MNSGDQVNSGITNTSRADLRLTLDNFVLPLFTPLKKNSQRRNKSCFYYSTIQIFPGPDPNLLCIYLFLYTLRSHKGSLQYSPYYRYSEHEHVESFTEVVTHKPSINDLSSIVQGKPGQRNAKKVWEAVYFELQLRR